MVVGKASDFFTIFTTTLIWLWLLIAPVPVHCFSITFNYNTDITGLRPIYVIFFEFLPISFQMKK